MTAIFEDTFLLTIVLIVASTLIIAFIRRVHIDKSLKGFKDDYVNIFMHDKTESIGKLNVANTGIELLYRVTDTQKHTKEMSYIIYKAEYKNIAFIARYAKDMNQKNQKQRATKMKRAYHPNLLRRLGRSINNFFRTIKDAMMDIFTQLSGKLTTISGGSAAVNQSTAYSKKVNQELVGTLDASYDPILEKYIGNVVVAEVTYADEVIKVTGVLKEYTSKYYELWDVDLSTDDFDARCDVLLPVSTCKVRHVGELVEKFNVMDMSFDIKKYNRHLKSLTSRRTRKKRNTDGRLRE
ncbi:MAG: hypothetical protein KAQ68_08250 [Clostridiales bacterium]|nr:hypothetical protein [Clostridiales bacterium]